MRVSNRVLEDVTATSNIQPTDMSQLQVGMTQILFSRHVFEAATAT